MYDVDEIFTYFYLEGYWISFPWELSLTWSCSPVVSSLRGRRLKGKGKGVLGARETRGAREEGGKEGNACQETIVFAIPPTNYVCKNNATVND